MVRLDPGSGHRGEQDVPHGTASPMDRHDLGVHPGVDERHCTCTIGVAALDQRGEGHRGVEGCIVHTQAVGASDAGDNALVSDGDTQASSGIAGRSDS